jgi:hypothetical protein
MERRALVIKANLVLLTKPTTQPAGGGWRDSKGLATFVVEVPVYVWTELLTHKRLVRNASSSRAQSSKRHQGMGWYTPPTFHQQGTFMQGGDPFPEDVQKELAAFWEDLHHSVQGRVNAVNFRLEQQGYKWAKEEVNRLLPTTKMVRGVVTATTSAWAAFLKLRANPSADRAMQNLAQDILVTLEGAPLVISDYHIPFDEKGGPVADVADYYERCMVAVPRLARVSTGAPGPGRRSDGELFNDLLGQQHLSPFEHCARYTTFPMTSALAVKPEDFGYSESPQGWGVRGWENYRAEIEREYAQGRLSQ